MVDFSAAREAMVSGQLRVSHVNEPRVIAAFRDVAREAFVPDRFQALAYADTSIDLGHGRTLMPPLVLARLLNTANLAPEAHVLDVGSGLGYSAALLARLAGTVVALESVADLHHAAWNRVPANVTCVLGPLAQGWLTLSPYDAIVLNGACAEIPEALVNQLRIGGIMVGVLADDGVGRGFIGRRTAEGFGMDPFFDAQVPYLSGFQRTPAFVF